MDPEIGSLVWIDSHPLSVSKLYLANFVKGTRVELLKDIREPLKVRTFNNTIYILYEDMIQKLVNKTLAVIVTNITSAKDMVVTKNGLFFADSNGLHIVKSVTDTLKSEMIYPKKCSAISILDDEVSEIIILRFVYF